MAERDGLDHQTRKILFDRFPNLETRSDENCLNLFANPGLTDNSLFSAKVELRRQLVLFYSKHNVGLPANETMKEKCLRFTAKANELLMFGNLELLLEDQYYFRFKTSQAFPANTDASRVLQFMLEQQVSNIQKLDQAIGQLVAAESGEAIAQAYFTETS